MQTFKQTRKLGGAGSFQNQLMGNNETRPVVGQPATLLLYTDRRVYEVISVSEDGDTCTLREMRARCIDYFSSQYEVTPNGHGIEVRLEYNTVKSCWGQVSDTIELTPKTERLLGWNFEENQRTLANLGVVMASRLSDGFREHPVVQKGLTRVKRHFSPVSIIFGVADYYYDPSF